MKQMKYKVKMTINYSVDVEVEALNEEEAKEKAGEAVCEDYYIEQFLAEAEPTKVERI